MSQLKLLSAALFAAAVIAFPAMARGHHTISQYSTGEAYADPAPAGAPGVPYAYGYHDGYGHRCVPAPRVGQFAGGPWGGNNIPCEPGTGTY
jgi:hypothetical protein